MVMSQKDAEVLDAEVLPVKEEYNPNKTQEIFNLVQISNPTIIHTDDKVLSSKGSTLSSESVESLCALYQAEAERWGLDIKFDVHNIKNNFLQIIDDRDQQIFEILLSKGFSKFKVLFCQRAILTIDTLMKQVSSPEVLEDRTLSLEYKYGMMEKLLALMQNVNQLYAEIKVENPDLKLRNLANRTTQELKSIQEDPDTVDLMKKLSEKSLKKNESTEK